MKHFNNTFNKLAFAIVVGLCLWACKEKDDTDIIGVSTDLARKNLIGNYVHFDIDSTAMMMTLREWLLSASDKSKGVFNQVTTGNTAYRDSTAELLLEEPQMSPDYLYMIIPCTYKNGVKKDLIWRNGVLEVDSQYVTKKSAIALVNILDSLQAKFQNMEFVGSDTTRYTRFDTAAYIAWKTDVLFVPASDTTKARDSLIDLYIAGREDTLQWFFKNFDAIKTVGKVSNGTKNDIRPALIYDSSRVIKRYVVVATDTAKKAPNRGKHGITYLTWYVDSLEKESVVGFASIKNCEMNFYRNATSNTGNFVYRERKWSREYYTKPTAKEATLLDSTCTVSNALWTINSIANAFSFSLLLKGDQTVKNYESGAGSVKRDTESSKENVFFTIGLSEFEPQKTTVDGNGKVSEVRVNAVYNGLKLKLK